MLWSKSDRCFCLLEQIVELAAVIILERGAHSLQGKKALKPGRLRLPQRLKSNLEIVWHIALPGSLSFAQEVPPPLPPPATTFPRRLHVIFTRTPLIYFPSEPMACP